MVAIAAAFASFSIATQVAIASAVVAVVVGVGLALSFVVFQVAIPPPETSATAAPTVTISSTAPLPGGVNPTTTVLPTVTVTNSGNGGGDGGGGNPTPVNPATQSYVSYGFSAVPALANNAVDNSTVVVPYASPFSSAVETLQVSSLRTKLSGVACDFTIADSSSLTNFSLNVSRCGSRTRQILGTSVGPSFQPVSSVKEFLALTTVGGKPVIGYRTGRNSFALSVAASTNGVTNWRTTAVSQNQNTSSSNIGPYYKTLNNSNPVVHPITGCNILDVNGNVAMVMTVNGNQVDYIQSSGGTGFDSYNHHLLTSNTALSDTSPFGVSGYGPAYPTLTYTAGVATGIGVMVGDIGNDFSTAYVAFYTANTLSPTNQLSWLPNYSTNASPQQNAQAFLQGNACSMSMAVQPTSFYPCYLASGRCRVNFFNPGTSSPTSGNYSGAVTCNITLTYGTGWDNAITLAFIDNTVSSVPLALWVSINNGLYVSVGTNFSGTAFTTPVLFETMPCNYVTSTRLPSGRVAVAWLTNTGLLKYTVLSADASSVLTRSNSTTINLGPGYIYPALALTPVGTSVMIAAPTSYIPCPYRGSGAISLPTQTQDNNIVRSVKITQTTLTNQYVTSSADSGWNSSLVGCLLYVSAVSSGTWAGTIPAGLVTAVTDAQTCTTTITQNMNITNGEYNIVPASGLVPHRAGTVSQSGTTLTFTNACIQTAMVGSTVTFADGTTVGPILSIAAPWQTYTTGTIAVAAGFSGGSLVTGTGTTWTSAMVGGTILFSGVPLGIITSVLSSTSLLVHQVNSPVTAGSTYTICYPAATTATATVATSQTKVDQTYTMDYYFLNQVMGQATSAGNSVSNTNAFDGGFICFANACVGSMSLQNPSGVTNPQAIASAQWFAFSPLPNVPLDQILYSSGVINFPNGNVPSQVGGQSTLWSQDLVDGLLYMQGGYFMGAVNTVSATNLLQMSAGHHLVNVLQNVPNTQQFYILKPNCPVKTLITPPNSEAFDDGLEITYKVTAK